MRVPILLGALGALSLCMSDARSQQSGESSAGGAPETPRDGEGISLDPDVWTTAGARVPALDLPAIVGSFGLTPKAGVNTDTWRFEVPNLYNVLRTVDDGRVDGGVTKRTLLIQFASW